MAMRERWRWRLLLVLTGLWASWVVVRYLPLLENPAKRRLRLAWGYAQDFLLWQVLGFVVLVSVVALVRPRWLGRVSAGYLGLSTLALLALPGDPAQLFVILAFILWCVLATAAVRRVLLRWTDRRQATWGLAAAGLYGAMIPLAFALGIVRGLTIWSVVPLALAVAWIGAVDAVRNRKRWQQGWIRTLDRLGAVGATSLEAIWIALALALVWALAPEMFSDSMRSYLPDLQDIARQQGIVAQYLDITRMIPRAFQAMCALGFVVGGYPIAKCLTWMTAGVLAAVVCDEVMRRSRSIDLGLLAAAVVLACPLLMSLSTSLMFDHAITLLTVASFVSLGRGLHEESRRGVAFSAFLMACVTQIKYNALIFCVVWIVCLAMGVLRRRSGRDALRFAGPAMLTLAVFSCPWYLYMLVTAKNPVFPYLNDLFKSPYWDWDRSMLRGLERFQLGESLWSRILFPWTVTFHTSRIVQRLDGALGFMLLALLPLLPMMAVEAWRRGRDLAIAGVGSIVGICVVTVYARYWLPGYPLLLMALILVLGRAVRGSRWRMPRIASPLVIVTLLAVLLLHLPLWVADIYRFPWPVYTGEVSDRVWIAQKFPGYPAVERLNEAIGGDSESFEPDRRVLATDYPAVYTIDADAYEFPVWHTSLHYLEDIQDLKRLLDRESVSHWVVDYSRADGYWINKHLETESQLWTVSRLIAAEAHVAIYDVSESSRASGYVRVGRHSIPAQLRAESEPIWQVDAEGWRDLFPRRPRKASSTVERRLEVNDRGAVDYVFARPADAELLRATLFLSWKKHHQSCVILLEWLDADQQVVGETSGGMRRARRKQWTHFFSPIPENAQYGRLRVTPRIRQKLIINRSRLDFFAPSQ